MALIVVRHIVRQPVGEVHRDLSALAASGGTMLVGVRLSDEVARAHPVLIDERSSSDRDGRAWWSAWNPRVGLPAGAGTLTARACGDRETVLEFCGSYAGPGASGERPDAFAFRRANALARAYLNALGENAGLTFAA